MFLTQKPGLTTFYHCSDDLLAEGLPMPLLVTDTLATVSKQQMRVVKYC